MCYSLPKHGRVTQIWSGKIKASKKIISIIVGTTYETNTSIWHVLEESPISAPLDLSENSCLHEKKQMEEQNHNSNWKK